GLGITNEDNDIRRDHAHVAVFIGPAAPEGLPGLEMGVHQPEFFQLVSHPLIGPLHVERAGQTWADLIHQAAGDLHDLKVAKAFITDLADHLQIDLLLRPAGWGCGQAEDGETRNQALYGWHSFLLGRISRLWGKAVYMRNAAGSNAGL